MTTQALIRGMGEFTHRGYRGKPSRRVHKASDRRTWLGRRNGRRTMSGNIFRQAKELLDKKDRGGKLTPEEWQTIHTALIPLEVKTDGIFPKDITIGEGLEMLAKLVEANGRQRCGVEQSGCARGAHNPEVVGSNPTAATSSKRSKPR